MGYFALKTNKYENDDLNNLECAMHNFKLCKPSIEYSYLIDFALMCLDKIYYKYYGDKDNKIIPNEIYYNNNEIYNIIISLFEDMISDKTIYVNYIVYIKLVLTKIKIKILELDILANLLSSYIKPTVESYFDDTMYENTHEYKFKTNLHFKELQKLFSESLPLNSKVILSYYDNERILFIV